MSNPEEMTDVAPPVVAVAADEDDESEGGALHRFREWVEDTTESALFASRWVLAPLYLGLVVALAVVVIVFIRELIAFVKQALSMNGDQMAIGVLGMLDVALLGNLLLLVIFSGYENFVSKIGAAQDHEDRPPWMGHLDFSGMKIKIVGSVVAISLIQLLQEFLDYQDGTDRRIFWRIMLHLTFVVSGLIFALMDYWGERRVTVETENVHSLDKHEPVEAGA